MAPARSAILAFTMAGVVLAVGGCSGESPLHTGEHAEADTAIVGSLGFSESEILAQIYGQVLEASGYEVEYDLTIGPRSAYTPDLVAGRIDLVPDYAGSVLLAADSASSASSTGAVVERLHTVLDALDLRVLNPAPAERRTVLAVTPAFAAANKLVGIGDLAPLGPALTIGAPAGFETGPFGRETLQSEYGVTDWKYKPNESRGSAVLVAQLLTNLIQVAGLYSTDPAILEQNLVVLEDPENLARAQNVIPLVNSSFYSLQLAALLNAVSSALTTEELIELNREYESELKPTAAEIASGWLTANGFLKH